MVVLLGWMEGLAKDTHSESGQESDGMPETPESQGKRLLNDSGGARQGKKKRVFRPGQTKGVRVW